MDKKVVHVVYEGDQWLSTKSLEVKAVCSDWDSVLCAVEHIAAGNGLNHRENLSDDCETDSVEDVLKEFENTEQYLGTDFGITFEVFELDAMPCEV